MTDYLRDFAAREAQREPPQRPVRAMRRCPDCGQWCELRDDDERCGECERSWHGVGRDG